MGRGNPYPHKYKFGKQTRTISYEFFKTQLTNGYKVDDKRDISLIILLYYLGCRVRALLELKREDIEIGEQSISFMLKALKHGIRNVPLKLPTTLPFMNIFLEYFRQIRGEKKVFSFSYSTALRIVKRVFPDKYTHYFRLNRCTQFLDDPNATLPEVRTWFGWKGLSSVSDYIGYSDRHVDRGVERIKKEVTSEQ